LDRRVEQPGQKQDHSKTSSRFRYN
jgi:hypothetical protein